MSRIDPSFSPVLGQSLVFTSGSGCDERFTWLAVFDEKTSFSRHGIYSPGILRKRSCPWISSAVLITSVGIR